jgi:ribonucleoside-diphosphate reductase alpha chain
MMESPDFGKSVDTAIKALTSVADLSYIESVMSIAEGNRKTRAIGLGQMNLHGYFGKEKMHYGDEESIDFTNMYFYTILYHALKSSNETAKKLAIHSITLRIQSMPLVSSLISTPYQNGSQPRRRLQSLFKDSGIDIPTQHDWEKLKKSVMKHGLYNQNLQAVPPTGSISYINNSTSSIHPIASQVEIRKEGKLGRVYYPAPYLTNDNREYFMDAYEIGPEKIIDVYAAATQHVDQGLSLTCSLRTRQQLVISTEHRFMLGRTVSKQFITFVFASKLWRVLRWKTA